MLHVRSTYYSMKKTRKDLKKGATKGLSVSILENEKGRLQDALTRSTESKIAERIIKAAKGRLENAQDSYDFGFANGLNEAARMVIEYGKERR